MNNLHNLTSKRSKKGTTLNLPRENPREVGQVIQFLYLNDLALTATEPQAQLDELLSAWKNATQFAVADMKRHVLQKLDTLSLAEKVHALNFIKATDQMYEYDIDVDLRIYFNKVAPSVVRKIRASERRCLDDMIEEGGSFAADLFSAYRRAFDISADVKGEGPARSAKGVGGDASGIMLIPMPARSGPVDNRTQWDRQHRIPALWTRVSEADKLLVSMVKADEGWIAILDAVQQKTREKSTITDLLERYNRLKANILRVESDDVSSAPCCVSLRHYHYHMDVPHNALRYPQYSIQMLMTVDICSPIFSQRLNQRSRPSSKRAPNGLLWQLA